MMFIPIATITVAENRQRKFFDVEHVDELRKSILSKGLMHAVVLERDGHTLIAGECRLRAVRSIYGSKLQYKYNGEPVPSGTIPAITLGELSITDTREAQLEENIARRDLSWQERVEAVRELHELRTAQRPGQTLTDTAKELLGEGNFYPSAPTQLVRDSIAVAKHLDDPDVRRAPSVVAATKIVRRKIAMEAARKELPSIASPHTLLVGDALELLTTLPPATYDIILTDPPYGIDADSFGTQAQIVHEYEDNYDAAMAAYDYLAWQGARVCKAQSHAFVFLHINYFNDVKEIFKDRGWEVFSTPIIWAKGITANVPGHIPWPNLGPRRLYEGMLYANIGKKPVNRLFPDVLLHEGVPLDQRLHAAEKPVGLLRNLLQVASLPGARVLDPFCGSGSIFLAATAEHMTATGIEIDEATAAIARGRM